MPASSREGKILHVFSVSSSLMVCRSVFFVELGLAGLHSILSNTRYNIQPTVQ